MTIDEQIEYYHNQALLALKEANRQCDIAAELARKICELEKRKRNAT